MNEWEQKREEINRLLRELQLKPIEAKRGYQLSVGGILNAYREGDISFEDACNLLEVKRREWSPQTQKLQSEIASMMERVFRNVWTEFYKADKAEECQLLDAIANELHKLTEEEKEEDEEGLRYWDTHCPCCGQKRSKE